MFNYQNYSFPLFGHRKTYNERFFEYTLYIVVLSEIFIMSFYIYSKSLFSLTPYIKDILIFAVIFFVLLLSKKVKHNLLDKIIYWFFIYLLFQCMQFYTAMIGVKLRFRIF